MSRNRSYTILGLVLLIASNISITRGEPDTTILNLICNQNLYGVNDPFGQLLSNVLDDLTYSAPDEADYTDYIVSTNGGVSCYGYARCNLRLLPDECCDCLGEAGYQLMAQCPYAVGGTIVMVDCRVRYENYQFY